MGINFSIIMPAYNAASYISQAINSVISQTCKSWELIIIDDGSTDDTRIIISKFQSNESRIKYIYQSNKKQAAARNYGISIAKGRWIAFLDSDDLWVPDKLERQLQLIKTVEANVFFSSGFIIDYSDKVISDYLTIVGFYNGDKMYNILYSGNPIPILSVIVSREWIDKAGKQNEDLKIAGCEDWDYWIRLAKLGARFYGVEEKLFMYRINPSGTSSNILQMKIAECTTLYNSYDQSRFSTSENFKIKERLIYLFRSIIPEFIKVKNRKNVFYFLKIANTVIPPPKLFIAQLIYFILGRRSERVIRFMLYH